MLNPLRVYFASPDHAALERAFSFDPRFSVMGGSGSGEEAMKSVLALRPDVLLLDQALLGLDGPEALNKLGETLPAPPFAVLFRRAMLPADTVCDVLLPYPCPPEACMEAAAQAEKNLLPALSLPWEAQRMEIAGALLKQLGTPDSLKGFSYLRLAAASLACAPRLGLSLSRRLYPFLACRFHTTPSAVERAVRLAVEHTWLKGSVDAAARLFGLTVDPEKGKPTNAECLFLLAQHVREETARRMARKAGHDEKVFLEKNGKYVYNSVK